MPLHRPRVLITAAVLAAFGLALVLPRTASADLPGPAPAGVSVQGNELFKGGVPWIPRGVQIVGIVAPDGALWGKYVPAHAHFGQAELAAAAADHADLIRFQVSEFGLDPDGPLYSPTYVREVRDAVATARGLGLAVIISLQAQSPAGEPVRCALPDPGAERAWGVLAPMFAGDSEVMYELYNEPAVGASQADWQTWLYGGAVPLSDGSGLCQAVGMQTLIDDVRADGAGNVIIVPGAAGEQTLSGMPRPFDPLSPANPQLAYGIHYPSLKAGAGWWDVNFGRVSASVPVILTEWNANSTTNCLSTAPVQAPRLIAYLASKGIGTVGFAFDLPGTVIADYSYAPTTYSGFTCGQPGGGPGQLLFNQFAAYARTAQTGPPPAWMVTAATVKRLVALSPAQTARAFDTPRTFVTGAGGPLLQRLALPNSVPTATFTDERKLAAAVNKGQLPAGTAAVAYDAEASSATPIGQRRHPAKYFSAAARVVHSHGLMLIASAATGLVQWIIPHTPLGRQDATFLRLKIPAAAARSADVYEVQAQTSESDPGAYARFVRAAGLQATRAHPGVELLTALSTNPQGQRQPLPVLLTAALSAPPQVSGYALDDPVAGRLCPLCTGPYPNLTLHLVDQLGSLGG